MSRHLPLGHRGTPPGRAPAQALTLTTTWMRLAIGLIATAIVVLALTNASGAQTTASVMRNVTVPASQQQEHFAQCLRDWGCRNAYDETGMAGHLLPSAVSAPRLSG